MYKIYADDTLIYDSRLTDYVITKGSISKEVNKSGSFTFTIYRDNPFYDKIEKLKTIISVYKGSRIIFRGRVLSESDGFNNDRTFTCEGELSFLLDSIIRPYSFTGTPSELLEMFISSHNSQVDQAKRFKLGTVTVTDPNDYIARSNTAYEDALTNINNHLISSLAGYLHITRDEYGDAVLNWLEDYPYESSQEIKFGENLLDFTKTNNTDEIATAIIPLGAKIEGSETDERLTIESVNGGLDYIYDQKAVDKYGWIFKTVSWDDVTLPENLLTKAREYLNGVINQNITIELSAIDLSLLDQTIDSFRLGDYIRIVSEPHGINDKLLLKKQTIDLLKPDNDKITLGYTYSSFTDTTLSNKSNNDTLAKKIEIIESNYTPSTVVTEEIETLRTLIDQTSTSITSEVLADYVSNDELVESQSTLYQQLSDSFAFNFSNLQSVVDENDEEGRRRYEEITKYIRFEDGNIILGESGNELTVRIENDRITFYDGENQVAYFSNSKLYITDAEVLASLKIGNFAFVPRSNGNLSFKKVGG